VTFGPVQMEPGPPGTASATPAGTFQVAWKAGPNYVSTTYHEAMPWATFFAPDGIAFHGGSLTTWSHGCVHLTVANAHYYNEHLPSAPKWSSSDRGNAPSAAAGAAYIGMRRLAAHSVSWSAKCGLSGSAELPPGMT